MDKKTNSSKISYCPICNRSFDTKLEPIKVLGINITPKKRLCEQCSNKKNLEVIHNENKLKILELQKKSNIPKFFYNTDITNISLQWKWQTKIINFIKNWSPNYSNNWRLPFLFGVSGTGKTLMSYCLINKAIKEYQIDAAILDIASLIANNKETDTNSYGKFGIQNINLLIIDSFGCHRINPWILDTLYTIIDNRLKKQLPTMITSNVDPTAIGKYFLELAGNVNLKHICSALEDRIFELCLLMKLNGTSIRLEKALKSIKDDKQSNTDYNLQWITKKNLPN